MDKELTNYKLEAIGVKNEFISAEPTEDETKWVINNIKPNTDPVLIFLWEEQGTVLSSAIIQGSTLIVIILQIYLIP